MRTVGYIPPVKTEVKAQAVTPVVAAEPISEKVEVKKTTRKKKVEE